MLDTATCYCYGCERLIPFKQANHVFRTGFYRTVHPLSLCDFCAQKEDNQEARQRESEQTGYDFVPAQQLVTD